MGILVFCHLLGLSAVALGSVWFSPYARDHAEVRMRHLNRATLDHMIEQSNAADEDFKRISDRYAVAD